MDLTAAASGGSGLTPLVPPRPVSWAFGHRRRGPTRPGRSLPQMVARTRAGLTMLVTSYRSPKTTVRRSPIGGHGLFAAAPIGRGEVVCVKGGHLLDRAGLAEHRRVVNEA